MVWIWKKSRFKSLFKRKSRIAPIIHNKIKYKILDKKIFVYSGIFATKKNEKNNWDFLLETLNDENFFKYLKKQGKVMANGYFSISTRLLKNL